MFVLFHIHARSRTLENRGPENGLCVYVCVKEGESERPVYLLILSESKSVAITLSRELVIISLFVT